MICLNECNDDFLILDLDVLGYDIIHKNTNLTCLSKAGKIDGLTAQSDQTTSTCKSICDKEPACEFFFINANSVCLFFQSCTKTRTQKHAGTTYQKIKGSISTFVIYNYF